MALVSLAPAHDIRLASISLTFVIILRVARYSCPVSCDDLQSLWMRPLLDLDSYHEIFSKCRRSSGDLWLAQVAYHDFADARFLVRKCAQLKSHWNVVHPFCAFLPAVAATMWSLARRLGLCTAEERVCPQSLRQRLDRLSARISAWLVSSGCAVFFCVGWLGPRNG